MYVRLQKSCIIYVDNVRSRGQSMISNVKYVWYRFTVYSVVIFIINSPITTLLRNILDKF